MRCFRLPSQLLLLHEPPADHLIDGGFGDRRCNRFAVSTAVTVIGNELAIGLQVVTQFVERACQLAPLGTFHGTAHHESDDQQKSNSQSYIGHIKFPVANELDRQDACKCLGHSVDMAVTGRCQSCDDALRLKRGSADAEHSRSAPPSDPSVRMHFRNQKQAKIQWIALCYLVLLGRNILFQPYVIA